MLIKSKSYVQGGYYKGKIKINSQNFFLFLQELLLLLWVSRVIIKVGKGMETMCKPDPELPIPWFVRDLAMSINGLASGPYS